MRDIQSLPSSVQEFMNQGNSMLARAGEYEREGKKKKTANLRNHALTVLGEVSKVIAQQRPELAAHIVLAAMNRDGFELTETKDTVNTVYEDQIFLGVRYGRDAVTTKNRETVTRRIKLI
jgi:hypothetical protein